MYEKQIEALSTRILWENLPVEGFVVLQGQEKIGGFRTRPDTPNTIYSHTKSFSATAIGIAIESGLLHMSDRLADFFPDKLPADPDPRILDITLQDLMNMSSGFDGMFLGMGDRRKGVGYPDYVQYMLSQPIKSDPGTKFCYSTADTILAGRMLEKATGTRLSNFMYEHVLRPLGIGWPNWEHDAQGHALAGASMQLKLEDMVKLGSLYLQDGCYNNNRIISHEWVETCTHSQIDSTQSSVGSIPMWNVGYSNQFWITAYPGYMCNGTYGQTTMVVPEKGIVFGMQCRPNTVVQRIAYAIHEELLSQL